jgi:hypothetical protein
LRPDGRTFQVWPADDLSRWPEEARRRVELKRAATHAEAGMDLGAEA